MITPKILKGFRDFTPETMIPKTNIIRKLENLFESYGFAPIDTPALEYTEILLGKGGGETDKQVYRFNDNGGRDVSLRFDLTVPLARFVAQHFNELTFPFKRFHIAPVWRGENTQKGRYREFYQCDFDIIGKASVEADIEILLLINSGMKLLNTGDFRININNRKILSSMFKKLNINDKATEILRTIDKISKIGKDNVYKILLDEVELSKDIIDKIFNFLNIDNSSIEILNDNIFIKIDEIKKELGNEHSDGINELEYIFNTLKRMDILNNFAFNPTITRGLDYYTGTIFETFVLDRLGFGSVCSGGRYDNLTGLYSKNIISGIGASFGLDRLIALLEDKNILEKKQSSTDILIFNIEDDFFDGYLKLAENLRAKNVNTEIFYERKKLDVQFKFAEKKSIKYVLFATKDNTKTNKYDIKDIKEGIEHKSQTIEQIVEIIK